MKKYQKHFNPFITEKFKKLKRKEKPFSWLEEVIKRVDEQEENLNDPNKDVEIQLENLRKQKKNKQKNLNQQKFESTKKLSKK
ncbi:hypothetical protein M0811_00137 [Anaeramoeba ignava]|uniref:Uncharacterized protein n=1 Tax=Anaeramoeba ignava TaxID=1746090 RepID=A0A9Q0LT60_ANAIG|nr:hypothetical protein M0811_00137 [Anaeramoeba ignava]